MLQCLPWQEENQHCSWIVSSDNKDPLISPHNREIITSHAETPFLSLRRAQKFVSLVLLIVGIILGASQAPGCAAVEHHSPILFAEQGGSHLGSQHHFYKQQCLAGHLEQTCLSVSCFFHCQSFSRPAFCFSSLLTAEACYSLPALLSRFQPLWAALCLPCCYSTALWTCFSRMRIFNRAFIPILSRVHSPSAALAAFASKMPAHWLKSAATQNKPWFMWVFFPPRPAGWKFCSSQL